MSEHHSPEDPDEETDFPPTPSEPPPGYRITATHIHPPSGRPIALNQALKQRYYSTRRDARDLQRTPFDLTFEEWAEIVKQRCHYCGTPPSNVARKFYEKHGFEFAHSYSGIDRKFRADGYRMGNCVPCCKKCNWLKRELDYDEFLSRVRSIAARLPGT